MMEHGSDETAHGDAMSLRNQVSVSCAVICLAVVLVGCANQPSRQAELGVGEYRVTVPSVEAVCSNHPTLWVHDCGRVQVNTISYGGEHQLETWMDWPRGTVSVVVYDATGTSATQVFTIGPSETNTAYEVHTGE